MTKNVFYPKGEKFDAWTVQANKGKSFEFFPAPNIASCQSFKFRQAPNITV
jgi:hypothetical protein